MAFTPPKNQIPNEWLILNARQLHARLLPWLDAHNDKKISAATLTAIYILIFLVSWKEKKFLNGKRDCAAETLLNASPTLAELNLNNVTAAVNALPVIEIFAHFRLRGIMERAQRALIKWQAGAYPIELFFHAPSAGELLVLQAQGRRVVTLFVGRHELVQKQHGRDPMTFVLHDLEHADEFFSDPKLFCEQKEFYRDVKSKLDAGVYEEALKDETFKSEFEYVIADMNSHPDHLKATLEFLVRDFSSRQIKKKADT